MQEIIDSLQELLKNTPDDNLRVLCMENWEEENKVLEKMIFLRKQIQGLAKQLAKLEQKKQSTQVKLDHYNYILRALDKEMKERKMK